MKHVFKYVAGPLLGRVGPPRALGWPETDSPRKTIADSGVEIQIHALRDRFVAMFCFENEA